MNQREALHAHRIRLGDDVTQLDLAGERGPRRVPDQQVHLAGMLRHGSAGASDGGEKSE